MSMQEVKKAIKVLARHDYRSVSNVVGEYVEKLIADAANGNLAPHCQKGFDLYCQKLGKVEVKSRNYFAKSKRCTLPPKKIESLDNFILVIMKEGEIERALVFPKKKLMGLISLSGKVYIDKQQYHIAKDITADLRNNSI